MSQKFPLRVNGRTATVDADPAMPLLYALRDDLGLNNPRFGCGLGQCGACTVQLNGRPVRSCVTPLSAVKDAEITTLAGLGSAGRPHPVQQAFIDEQVPQCGFCLNGWVMSAAALLKKTPNPTDAEIRQALTGIKCRCATQVAVLRAVKRAARAMATA
jgi:aerobic-type carbon monoxide dehydrogenase small subunit (CoxS/CutS family)